jgi:hypothetical protein
MTPGAAVWLVIGVLALVLGIVTTTVPSVRAASPQRVLGRFLACWAGRAVLLALWAEAGFHLLCQRP